MTVRRPGAARALVCATILLTAFAVTTAARESPRRSQDQSAPRNVLTVSLHPLADTVIAHQSAWLEIRITNPGPGGLDVPFRGGTIVGAWRFEDGQGRLRSDWPDEKEIEKAPVVRLGPGETLYEVLSLETAFGLLTEPGTVRAWCRVKDVVSEPVTVTRRSMSDLDEPSILRTAGSLMSGPGRDSTQVRLWAACSRGAPYFDCDEALFTVAWDRMQSRPADAQAVVDTLIARHAGSGWCRPALYEICRRLPESAGRRWIDAILARGTGGVAGLYALELRRRAGFGQFPAGR
jgi:hypothetical protein